MTVFQWVDRKIMNKLVGQFGVDTLNNSCERLTYTLEQNQLTILNIVLNIKLYMGTTNHRTEKHYRRHTKILISSASFKSMGTS